jgi:hypothetical protein
MPVREFLRGGYKDITETTVVSNHGRPVFTVLPYVSPLRNPPAPPPKEKQSPSGK